MKNFSKFCGSIVILSVLAAVPSSAKEASKQALRDGAVVCPVNPETGLQNIYLPPIFTRIVEQSVTGPANTYLEFQPLVIGADGKRVQRAEIREKVLPAILRHSVRDIVVAPSFLVVRDETGRLFRKDDPSQSIDEAKILRSV